VRHGEQWVSVEDKEKLERGLVLHEGQWMDPDEAKRAQGLALFEGEWLPRAEAQARRTVARAESAAGRPLRYRIDDATLICGTIPRKELRKLEAELGQVLGWFVATWQVESALRLFGNRPCEIYLFDDDLAYERTVDWLAGRCNFIPPGWTTSVRAGYGFVWTDPIAISSARLRKRPFSHLIGHSYHNFGHLMLNSLGYRGRLLPAWYDEGVAALTELRAHGKNAVFCRSSFQEGQGTTAGGGRLLIESSTMRDGSWRRVMREALEARRIDPFDRLAQREFSQLELVDVATSIAIVEWLESRGGATLARFHAALRAGAPPAPTRVILDGRRRRDYYDNAFESAVGMKTLEADAAWRSWFLSR
jgi:hypothetical protein